MRQADVLACCLCVAKILFVEAEEMENPEEVLQSLDEFAKLKPKDIPRELEDYLSYVAKTGDPVYQWSIVKCLFREKLLNVITDFYETSPAIDLPPCPNVDPFNYESMKNSLLERLDSFPSAPFTVQRLCELLTTPRKEYSRADKFMRAIEKNILVVSTREPGNVRRTDNNGQHELLMNGVMDGRGIELSEAIETVSSEGVNLMHSDENEVNVTENENVPVECAGMEEIDMEEQGDHMEASNSSVWKKEQSEVLVQSEEDGTLNYDDGSSGEGENKSKESSECFEISSTGSGERGHESAELPGASENEVDTLSDIVPGDTHPRIDTCLSSSDENLGETDENGDLKDDCLRSESDLTSENSTVRDESPEQTNEETGGNLPEETKVISTPSGQVSVDSSSPPEDLSESGSNTETVLATADPSNETVASNVISETVSSEPVTLSAGPVRATNSTSTEIPLDQICVESVEIDVDSATKTDNVELTGSNPEHYHPNDVISTDSNESNTLEEGATSSPQAEAVPYEEVTGTGIHGETEQTTDKNVVLCQQDEAMEVDDSNINSQLASADVDEPMDQSEQPTES